MSEPFGEYGTSDSENDESEYVLLVEYLIDHLPTDQQRAFCLGYEFSTVIKWCERGVCFHMWVFKENRPRIERYCESYLRSFRFSEETEDGRLLLEVEGIPLEPEFSDG